MSEVFCCRSFVLFSFFFLGSSAGSGDLKHHILSKGYRELRKVWNQLKHIPALKRFLGAFFFYSMGVQTVMLVAGIGMLIGTGMYTVAIFTTGCAYVALQWLRYPSHRRRRRVGEPSLAGDDSDESAD